MIEAVIAFAAVTAAATGAGEAAPRPDHPPVLIRESVPSPPIEVAGTGLAPTVKVRATVNTRGRLTDVRVLEVVPSTAFDRFFEREIRDALARWRYAPAQKGGQQVETKLDWILQFVPKSANGQGAGASPPMLHVPLQEGEPDDEAEDALAKLTRYVAGLDRVAYGALRTAQIAKAESQLGATRHETATRRFIVVTDSAQPGTAEKIGGNLEAAYAVTAKLLGPAIEPQPASDKVAVYVYRSRSSFEAVRSELGVPAFAAGFYGPTGMLSFSLEVPVVEELLAEMIHESTHAYLHQHVVRHGVALPRWLNEGFAMYMGNSDIRDGDLVPGSHRAFAALHAPGVVYHDRTRSKVDADQVRAAMKKGAALRVADLLSARPSDFYGEKVELYYPQAWLLVHFLIHGGDRWGEERFPKLMLYAAEGFPVDAAIRAVYGLDGPALETSYQSYVSTF